MQASWDHWQRRRSFSIPPELIGLIAPTRLAGIYLRGIFQFPIEQNADSLIPLEKYTYRVTR